MMNDRKDKFKVEYNLGIIKKALEDAAQSYFFSSDDKESREFNITVKKTIDYMYIPININHDRSVGEIISDLYKCRDLGENTKNSIESKILKVYTPIMMAISEVNDYKYSELLKIRYKYNRFNPSYQRVSENLYLYGEIPTLTYLLEKDRWKTVSNRRYKKYIYQLICQCHAYAFARFIVDTPPHPDHTIGDIFTLKVKYNDK